MGEIIETGRERVIIIEGEYTAIDDEAMQLVEERERNKDIISSLDIVDDDDRIAVENAKDTNREIAMQLAEAEIEAPKKVVNENIDVLVEEMDGYKSRELADADKVSAMDGNYAESGSSLSTHFSGMANEFNEIATCGKEIQSEFDEKLEAKRRTMSETW